VVADVAQLVFDAKTGKIYGAQAVGQHGIDKRIDVIAMAIQMRATVMDLVQVQGTMIGVKLLGSVFLSWLLHNLILLPCVIFQFQAELCYSPQYGAAKDPVNIAGMVASNIVQGLVPLTSWDAVWDIVRKDQSTIPPVERLTVLDVRYCDEVEAEGTLTTPEGVAIPVVNIPLPKLRSDPTVFDTIRDSLPEPNAPVAVLCREGVRANSAVRLLRQHGFDARLLSGGFYTALLMKGAAFPARTVSVDDDRFPERPDTMTGACASPESKKPKL
jgi:rhodanese-related sulfurtransferase